MDSCNIMAGSIGQYQACCNHEYHDGIRDDMADVAISRQIMIAMNIGVLFTWLGVSQMFWLIFFAFYDMRDLCIHSFIVPPF